MLFFAVLSAFGSSLVATSVTPPDTRTQSEKLLTSIDNIYNGFRSKEQLQHHVEWPSRHVAPQKGDVNTAALCEMPAAHLKALEEKLETFGPFLVDRCQGVPPFLQTRAISTLPRLSTTYLCEMSFSSMAAALKTERDRAVEEELCVHPNRPILVSINRFKRLKLSAQVFD